MEDKQCPTPFMDFFGDNAYKGKEVKVAIMDSGI